MPYAILRTTKLSTYGNIAASGHHTYRNNGFAPNAISSRTHLNKTLLGTPGDVLFDVKERVAAITDKRRKNGVLAIEYLLAASPGWFVNKSKSEINKWVRENMKFLKEKHGRNLVHASLHLDESSPHIVAYVVPEIDGKLNCRAILGGRKNLTNLQTEYARSMSMFGLDRGIEGSKAEHVKVKKYYTAINDADKLAIEEIEKLGKPSLPPKSRLFSSTKSNEVEFEQWMNGEVKRTEKLVETACGSVLALNESRKEIDILKKANGELSNQNETLKHDLNQAYQELNLDKDEIGKLRKADVSLVAQRLSYMGVVAKKENAIDLVKRVNSFDYEQAVAWLYHEIGPEQAGMAVSEDLKVKEPERPFTPAENTIKQAIIEQTDALGCDKYRLSIISERKGVKPYLPGNRKDEEIFFNRKELINQIPWLRQRNNERDHIFITPMDDHAFYVLLDDVRAPLDQIEKAGFKPCLVQKSSWESTQMVFKVTGDLDRKHVISYFNKLNRMFGDEKINALRHPFRLAGFRNPKPKHERDGNYPFVEIIKAVNQFCTKSIWLIQRLASGERSLGAVLSVDSDPVHPENDPKPR